MRKTIVLLLVSVLMVCLCSCGNKGSVPSASELSPKQEETGYVVVKADREASDTSLVSTKKNVIYAYTLSDVTFPDQFTAVVISFLDTLPDGSVRESSFPHTKDTIDSFHEKHPYTKVVAGLGGASNSERLGEVIMDPSKRKVLAETTAKLLKDRGIAGVDLGNSFVYFANSGFSYHFRTIFKSCMKLDIVASNRNNMTFNRQNTAYFSDGTTKITNNSCHGGYKKISETVTFNIATFCKPVLEKSRQQTF